MSRLFRIPRCVCLLFLLLCFLTTLDNVHGEDNAFLEQQPEVAEEEDQCPVYRTLDTANPTSYQYLAPDGCKCVDGMDDLHCSYCYDDKPCQDVNSTHVCRQGVVFAEGDTYKSYQCNLFGTLETFFTGGKIAVYADLEQGTVDVAVYNTESVNDIHAIDCHITGCVFATGGSNVQCELAVCNCTEWCSPIARNVIETMVTNKPASVTVESSETGFNSYININVEDAPFPFEALCNTTACVANPTAVLNETVQPPTVVIEQEWKASATFSLIVLCILFGVFCLLTVCIVLPYCLVACNNRKNNRNNNRNNNSQPLSDHHSLASSHNHNNHHAYNHHYADEAMARNVLEFHHISRVVTLKSDAAIKANGQKEKTILNNISGRVESGTVLGIMGPSGAGKSSLLNVLAAVDNGKARNSGQILLNGKLQRRHYRKKVAYVQQDDSLYETLTVQECIEYSALLRLPKGMTRAEKQASVQTTLQELRLQDIATNRIGSGGANAGVSGGERKRVSIGMELVAHPAVLFLDEPSSGLDAYAANQIMKVLHELVSSRNRIVILSIHQPSMKSFLAMDQILLLGKGKVMYNGKPGEVQQYLEEYGFPCPALETVADHMLDVVSNKDNHAVLTGPAMKRSDMEGIATSPSNQSVNANHHRRNNSSDEMVEDPYPRPVPEEPSSIFNEVVVLFGRTSKDIFRNKGLFLMQMTICTVLAFFGGGIFSDVSNDLAGFQNRMGAFYFSLSFFGFASFSSMDIFVKERHIFVRETGSKYYRAFSYFLTKTILDMFALRIVPVTVFVFIFYWLMGLKNEPDAFIVFWATLVLFNVCAGVISICISIATPTVGQANLLASVWFLIMLLFGGFLVNVETMSPWFAWLRYVSIFYYSFEILMSNELSGLLLSFDAPGYPSIPVMGEVFLETIGFQADRQTQNLICLCSLAAGFSILAYLLLCLRVPASAGRHFNRMQKENKYLSRTMNNNKLDEIVCHPQNFIEEDTSLDTPPHQQTINVTKIHDGLWSSPRSTSSGDSFKSPRSTASPRKNTKNTQWL